MKVSVLLTLLGSVTSAFASCNCKCQDPSGVGPQWNDLTEEACDTQFPGESDACFGFDKNYHGDQHHQCSSSSCCIDGGAFDQWCRDHGAPGAFCWT